MSQREANLLRSLTETTRSFYLWVAALSAVVLWGLYAYILQLRQGLVVTGMRDQVSWGLYIANFVFFIGISHAGTLISAILRVTHATWRRPVTRLAEVITVLALCIGAPMVIIDLGRPDRLLNLFRYGRIQSPILWDVLSVTTYLAGCILYLYIPMIPDMAVLAARPELVAWRRRFYKALSLGWTGTVEQHHLLEKAISVMAVVIIPLAVSVHTVVSWIFAMTLRPGWDSSIFGPYFVIGAIYSGAAAVVFSMYVLRRVLRLEDYLERLHFRNLGLLLLAFALLYLYFNINEYLTMGYKFEERDRTLLARLFVGDYAPFFWTVQMITVFVPAILLIAVLALKRNAQFTIPGVALASFLVIVGAWAKRYLIVIPTLASPYLPAQRVPLSWTHYRPTWVEWSITAGAFALFLLLYTLFCKWLPMISIWETRQGEIPAGEEKAGVAPGSRRWGFVSTMSLFLMGYVLVSASAARAQPPRKVKSPIATTLAASWKLLAPSEAAGAAAEETPQQTSSGSRVFLFLKRPFAKLGFGAKNAQQQKAAPAIVVTATLRDAQAQPVAFQAVSFSLKASFGMVDYGSRPTNEAGQAQLLIRERRYGQYPIEVAYDGRVPYASTRTQVLVDFGARPAPALPQQAVLIAPYAAPAIGLPFLLFYGTMWGVFLYAFGYLVLWQMRRSGDRTGSQAAGKAE